MNRPIFIILIGYIIGIIWGLYFKISIVFLYAILLAIFIIINLRYTKKKFKILSLKRYFRYIKLVFKVNIILIIIVSSFISNSILNLQNKKYEELFKNYGKLKIKAIVISNKEEKEYYDIYKIKVSEGEFKNTNLYLSINKEQQLEYGNKVLVMGEFQEPQESSNYKGFNYKEYLKTLKIYGTIKADNVKVLEKQSINPILQISNNIFLNIKNNIQKTYSKNISPIILGVMLGYTNEIDENIKEDFSKSNISHVLAVSGMHISYIVYLVTNTTKGFFGKRKSKVIASGVLIFYMFITDFSISIVRATIMGVLVNMSFVFYRKSDTLNNISIAALITLINNPFAIKGMSFLLTYGGTLGIVYFNPTIEKILKGIKIKNRKWKYVFLNLKRKCKKIIEIISVSISAQIIIGPIMVLIYNTAGGGFIITNLLLSFIIGPIVMGGFIQILISFISIELSSIFAKIIEIPTYLLILISKINIGNFMVVTPEIYKVILYYISIFIWIYLYKVFHSKYLTTTQERVRNTMFLIKYKLMPYKRMVGIFFALAFVCLFIRIQFLHNLKVYFIDVGQGDSTLIVTPRHKSILIDGGGSNTYDVGENTLVPYLLDRKIKKLDYVIVTHMDQDHVRTVCLQ